MTYLYPQGKAFKEYHECLISWLWSRSTVHQNLTWLHKSAYSRLCSPHKYQWSFGGPFVQMKQGARNYCSCDLNSWTHQLHFFFSNKSQFGFIQRLCPYGRNISSLWLREQDTHLLKIQQASGMVKLLLAGTGDIPVLLIGGQPFRGYLTSRDECFSRDGFMGCKASVEHLATLVSLLSTVRPV